MLYLIPIAIVVIAWVIYRKDYFALQWKYKVKLPFICHVCKTDEADNIMWGARRYLHIRQDGRKDRRYSYNIKWWFPTKIYIGGYLCKIWNIKRARATMRKLEPKMDLPLSKIQFLGQIEGDPIVFFQKSNKIFIRWCGKLFMFYGYECELWKKPMHILAYYRKSFYVLHCELRRPSQPVTARDIYTLWEKSPNTKWVFITTGEFDASAIRCANRYHVLLMDRTCLDHTFLYGRPMFL